MLINGEHWKFEFVPPDHHMLYTSAGNYTLGVCDDRLKTIYVNNKLSRQKLRKVLCHEITHAAMFSYNVEMSLAQEELVADLIATFGREIICQTNKVLRDLSIVE